jgi:DNA-binding IclR family transcriptional regulator
MDQEERRSFGALSVIAPMNRMQDNRFKEQIPRLLRRAANVIEIELEYGDERSLS